ncbi:MAG: hypothetical protein U5Q03_06410 [Bacteroidota bacterium]|nr:hypothetical protein [Bacteroidota bacterium]
MHYLLCFHRKTILLTLFLLFFIFNATSQKTFMEAYVLVSRSDTLYGEINNKNYYLNSQYCDFRPSDTDTVVRYYPGEIFGYSFMDGKFYISRELYLDGKDSLLFLEYLVNGELDVYFMQDKGRINHYFVARDSLPIRELKYEKKVSNREGELMMIEKKPYLGILTYYTSDAPQLKDEIGQLNAPEHKELINFAEKYHNLVCKDDACIVYEKRVPLTILVEGIGQFTSFREKIFGKGTENQWTFIGASVYLMNPRFSEKSYLGLGIMKAPWSNRSGDFISQFKIPISYSYIHPKNGFSPTFRGAFNLFPSFEYPITISFTPGVKFQLGKVFARLFVDMEFVIHGEWKISYLATSYGIGLNYRIKRR